MLLICSGAYRTGSTLQYNMAASVLELNGEVERVGFVPKCKEIRLFLNGKAISRKNHIVKTHDNPFNDQLLSGSSLILFTYRDVRHSALSMKRKWPTLQFSEIIKNIDKMIEMEESFKNFDNCLIQAYEDLLNRPDEAVLEISSFINQNVSSSDLERIVKSVSFESLASKNNGIKFKKILFFIFSGIKNILFKVSCGKIYEYSLVLRIRGYIEKKILYDSVSLVHVNHVTTHKEVYLKDNENDILNRRYKSWLDSHGYKI